MFLEAVTLCVWKIYRFIYDEYFTLSLSVTHNLKDLFRIYISLYPTWQQYLLHNS